MKVRSTMYQVSELKVVRDEINLALSYRPEGDIFWKDEVRSWKYEKIKGERWESTKYYEPSIGTGSGKR